MTCGDTKATGKSGHPDARLAPDPWAFNPTIGQRRAANKIADDEDGVFITSNFMDAHNVRMLKLGSDLGLVYKAAHCGPAAHQLRVDDLHVGFMDDAAAARLDVDDIHAVSGFAFTGGHDIASIRTRAGFTQAGALENIKRACAGGDCRPTATEATTTAVP